MLAYVLSKNGTPLMPCKPSKARKLLKDGDAKVLKKEPFTIQLLYGSSGYRQNISLGVDSGSRYVGLSATTDSRVLYESVIELRSDIVGLLATRRQNRRSRRNKKMRYRKPRFNNRSASKRKGWLAPSVQHKIDCHLQCVADVYKILPITNIVVEVASFNIQRIKNAKIKGIEYQHGEQMDFWNVREYVLFRDNHICQCCRGESKDDRLNVHHIESRKTGGDAPNNLITLCETCHKGYHAGRIKLPEKIKRGMSFRDAAFMGIMRWAFYDKLTKQYKNVSLTYGYITKNTRIQNGLPKEHFVDARCISGNPLANPLEYYFYKKKVRCHNRQIHKVNILKGGKKKLNQAPYIVKGFRLFDKIKYNGQECFIFGRRSSGYFDLRMLDGTKVHGSASYKKLQLLSIRKSYLIERRPAISSCVQK